MSIGLINELAQLKQFVRYGDDAVFNLLNGSIVKLPSNKGLFGIGKKSGDALVVAYKYVEPIKTKEGEFCNLYELTGDDLVKFVSLMKLQSNNIF